MARDRIAFRGRKTSANDTKGSTMNDHVPDDSPLRTLGRLEGKARTMAEDLYALGLTIGAHLRPMNLDDANHLATIVNVARGNKPVIRLIEGRPFYGTARALVREGGSQSERTDDIRDLYLEVVAKNTGHTVWWRVSTLLRESLTHHFMEDIPDIPEVLR